MAIAFALLVTGTLSAPAPPPGGPCPTEPANYCDCGTGVNTKWLCRANNGYVWESNDDAPKDPCPAKYPTCTTHPGEMVSEMAPPAPLCFHMDDVEDHKCFEACSTEGKFATKGITATGTCPTQYNSVDTSKTVLQCPDGITNVRYCAATALNVTITTKGEAGGFEALMAVSEATPAPAPLVIHLQDPKEPHCSDLTVDFSMDGDLDQVKEWWAAKKYMYTAWATGPCDAKFNSVDHLEHPIGVAGVTTREKGIKQPASDSITVTMIGGFNNIMPAAPSCHYDDPFQASGCKAGEMNITVQGVAGSFCAPKCDDAGACPTDVCPGTVAKPQCALQDGSGNKYCALICDPKGKGTTCSSDEHMTCQPIQGTGLCTYYS